MIFGKFTWFYLYMSIFDCRHKCKVELWFVGRLMVNHYEHHNSVIRSAIEVHELLMESLFDKHSNKSSPTSISRRQGLQIIKTFHHCFCRELRRCHGPNIHHWDPDPSWSMPQERGEHLRDGPRCPPP